MVTKLKNTGYNPLQFKFNENKPDLTKLDYMFALLSLETTDVNDRLSLIEQDIKLNGIQSVFSEVSQIKTG